MNPTTINWPGLTHTWNPVVGCKRGCYYCYAKKLHEKRHLALLSGKKLPEQYRAPFNDMQFIESRLKDKDLSRKKPCVVFVGSMSDIEYWEPEWVNRILDEICCRTQHTFMFLSKNPVSYAGFYWPENTMQGLTITCTQTEHCQKEMIKQISYFPRPFLSIEPLLGELVKTSLSKIERVICGPMTGGSAIKMKAEWIRSVCKNVPGHKLHWKNGDRE